MYSYLLVDDEPVALKALKITIQQSDLPVGKIETACDGEAAIRCLEENFYDIVLTDIRMPKMDGLELCRIIRLKYPDTAVLLVTGYEDFKYAHQAIKYDVKDYLLKPVTREGIISSLKKVVHNLQKQKKLLLLPLYEVEETAGRIADALWGDANAMPEENAAMLFEKLDSFPMEYCKIVASDVLEMVRRKTAERAGCSFEVHFRELSGNDRETVRRQLADALQKVKDELERFRSTMYYNVIEAAKLYLREHLDENVTLEDLAGNAGMAPSYFSQVFSRSTGQTFVGFRTEIRMNRAKELLCRPDISVKEIAFKVGYNDENHFTRTFKKYSGSTPTEFRMKRGMG